MGYLTEEDTQEKVSNQTAAGKSQETPNIGKNEKCPELSYISGGSVKCYNHFVRLYSSFL